MSTLTPPTAEQTLDSGSTPQQQWVAPAEVRAVSGRDLTSALEGFSHRIGMRPAGWVMLTLGILVLVAGQLLEWTELRVAGILALVLVVIAVLFTIGRPKLDVLLVVPERHMTVGSPASGALLVTNAGRRRTLPGRIDVPVGAQVATISLPSMGIGTVHQETFTIPTRRRAVIEVGPAGSVQGDPFSLMGRETAWTDTVEVYVHPRTVPLPGRQTGFMHDLEGHPTSKIASSDMSFHALREYVPGDDRRHVHWRSSARTGQLMVRQFEETRQSRIAIALDLAEQSYGGDDEFEEAVSVAASFVLQSAREENPLSLVTNVEAQPGLTPNRIMNELSGVERLQRTHVTDVTRIVREREANASIVILVTGSKIRPDRLRRAATLLDVDTRVVAVRISADALLTVETVSNVTLIQLPGLGDLPRAMRRAAQ